jgi:hypothetical protein
MRRKQIRPISLLIVTVFFVGLSLMFVYAVNAEASTSNFHPTIIWDSPPSATVVKNGEVVVITTDRQMYVAKEAKIVDIFMWLYKVRYPKEMESLLIPTRRIHKVYVHGFREE